MTIGKKRWPDIRGTEVRSSKFHFHFAMTQALSDRMACLGALYMVWK
jgi:hypothetical protein